MRSIWDRELTTKRMVRDGVTVSVLRSREHEYNVSPSSRARLNSILPLAEYVGVSLFVFPEKVRRPTPLAPDTATPSEAGESS
jgi:hypothetical protein